MAVSDLHGQVAAVALGAAAGHGFALGGGNALLAHGVITRPTQDVDLFTDQEHGVEAAASAVQAALRGAGYRADRRDKAAGLGDIFPGMGEGLAEWLVTAADGEQMIQWRTSAGAAIRWSWTSGPSLIWRTWLAARPVRWRGAVEPRDYADTAAMLGRYSPAQLIGFARRLDPGLTGRDFADAGRRLDQMPDRAFAAIGLSACDVAAGRERFAAWPRTTQGIDAGPPAGVAWHPASGRSGARPDAQAGWEAEPRC